MSGKRTRPAFSSASAYLGVSWLRLQPDAQPGTTPGRRENRVVRASHSRECFPARPRAAIVLYRLEWWRNEYLHPAGGSVRERDPRGLVRGRRGGSLCGYDVNTAALPPPDRRHSPTRKWSPRAASQARQQCLASVRLGLQPEVMTGLSRLGCPLSQLGPDSLPPSRPTAPSHAVARTPAARPRRCGKQTRSRPYR